MIVVKSQVKEEVKRSGSDVSNVSSDFVKSLNKEVKDLIEEACERAEGNNRKTVMGKDV